MRETGGSGDIVAEAGEASVVDVGEEPCLGLVFIYIDAAIASIDFLPVLLLALTLTTNVTS